MSKASVENEVVVDATNQILGRMCSIIAKMLLEGKRVYVVNAEKAVLSGEPKRVINGYLRMFEVTTYRNPEKQGIRRERSPQRIVKSAVRGMLPIKKPRGREAFKRLRVYVGVPKEFAGKKMIRFPEADASKLKTKFIYVGELAKRLGWRGVVE